MEPITKYYLQSAGPKAVTNPLAPGKTAIHGTFGRAAKSGQIQAGLQQLNKSLESFTLEKLSPVTLFVNYQFQLIHHTGDLNKLLHKSKEVHCKWKWLEMLPEEVRLSVSAVFLAAKYNSGRPTLDRQVKFDLGSYHGVYDIEALVIPKSDTGIPTIAITFTELSNHVDGNITREKIYLNRSHRFNKRLAI